jgi:hypothetical protein
MRGELLAQGILRMLEGSLIFTKDHLFKSPSAAATTVLGRSANGWIEWKNSKGKTLDELKRQTVID